MAPPDRCQVSMWNQCYQQHVILWGTQCDCFCWATYFGTFVGQQKVWRRNSEKTWQHSFDFLNCHGLCHRKRKTINSLIQRLPVFLAHAPVAMTGETHFTILLYPSRRFGKGVPITYCTDRVTWGPGQCLTQASSDKEFTHHFLRIHQKPLTCQSS